MKETIPKLRKILRFTGRILLGSVLFVFAYCLVMFLLSRITVPAEDTTDRVSIPIYIKTNGVHSDIVVPYRNALKDWSGLVPSAHTARDDDDARFLSVGWGDRDFYLHTPTWADLEAATALRATLYLGKSVIHAELYHSMEEGARCVKLMLTEAQYLRLTAYIESGFNKVTGGRPVVIPGGAYGDYDAFYEGTGSYSAVYSCNSWVNEGLKACGQKAALWTLTDGGIFCHHE